MPKAFVLVRGLRVGRNLRTGRNGQNPNATREPADTGFPEEGN